MQGTMLGARRQHQYADRTLRGRVNQNDRQPRNGESTSIIHGVTNLRIEDG